MRSGKSRQVATAVGFLSGLLASLDALRDVKILWPADALWEGLHNAQRLELGGGIALILVSLVIAVVKGTTE